MIKKIVISLLTSYLCMSYVYANTGQEHYDDMDPDSPQRGTLHRNIQSSNTSELFAKVLELEEQAQELTGKLQHSEYKHEALMKKVDNLYAKLSKLETDAAKKNQEVHSVKPSHNQDCNETLSHSINLIKSGKNSEAIDKLNNCLIKTNTQQTNQITNEGEIHYWLGKAHTNNKSHDKATFHFVKSYKHYSDVKANDSLFELIDVLIAKKNYNEACPLIKNKLDKTYLAKLSNEKKAHVKSIEQEHCTKVVKKTTTTKLEKEIKTEPVKS